MVNTTIFIRKLGGRRSRGGRGARLLPQHEILVILGPNFFLVMVDIPGIVQ